LHSRVAFIGVFGMKEVIRLVRLTLLLRIFVALASALVTATLMPGTLAAFLDMAVALPSCFLLAFTLLAALEHWESERFVKALLVTTILVEALEAIMSRIGLQWILSATGIEVDEAFRRFPGMIGNAAIMRLPLTVPLLFITIPALLGAWINGKRNAFRWAAFAVLLSLLSSISTSPPEFMQWRLNAGLFGAQGIVLFITCYFVGTLADEQRREQAELEKANRQLAEQALVREQLATSRERVRLARDLHDTLAHTLAGLVVQAKVVDTLLDKDPVAARRELARVQAVAKDGLEEARAAIGDLRANVVEDLGLNGAVRRIAETTGQRTGIQISVDETGDEVQLEKDCAETLFRIVQEALNNVERHAHAQHIHVSIHQTPPPDPVLTIRVKDDGIGFNVTTLDDERFGLRGMRERAELIGAHLRLESTLGTGTTVIVTLKQRT
jgi:signal transduction histidine kinase